MSSEVAAINGSKRAFSSVDSNSGLLVEGEAVLVPPGGPPAATEKKKKKKAKKTAVKKKITKTEINEKLKWATKAELTALLKDIFAAKEEFSEDNNVDGAAAAAAATATTMTILKDHVPDNAPYVSLGPDDPLLKQCFHCKTTTANLVDFHNVKSCGECNKPSYSTKEVCEYFGFSEDEVDKLIKPCSSTLVDSSNDGGGCKILVYMYPAEAVIKAVKKRNKNGGGGGTALSLFNMVAKKSNRRRPTVGELIEAAKTQAKKSKAINDGLKYSEKPSLEALVSRAVEINPTLKNKDSILDKFVPAKLPYYKPKAGSEAAATDPILNRCFICTKSSSTKNPGGGVIELIPFHDVQMCTGCDINGGWHGGTLTRDKVMSYFYFTKTEADNNIPRKTTTGGFYKSKIYVYKVKAVVAAAKKKHGSLYNMSKQEYVKQQELSESIKKYSMTSSRRPFHFDL